MYVFKYTGGLKHNQGRRPLDFKENYKRGWQKIEHLTLSVVTSGVTSVTRVWHERYEGKKHQGRSIRWFCDLQGILGTLWTSQIRRYVDVRALDIGVRSMGIQNHYLVHTVGAAWVMGPITYNILLQCKKVELAWGETWITCGRLPAPRVWI